MVRAPAKIEAVIWLAGLCSKRKTPNNLHRLILSFGPIQQFPNFSPNALVNT